jgi:hypothetical protein
MTQLGLSVTSIKEIDNTLNDGSTNTSHLRNLLPSVYMHDPIPISPWPDLSWIAISGGSQLLLECSAT